MRFLWIYVKTFLTINSSHLKSGTKYTSLICSESSFIWNSLWYKQCNGEYIYISVENCITQFDNFCIDAKINQRCTRENHGYRNGNSQMNIWNKKHYISLLHFIVLRNTTREIDCLTSAFSLCGAESVAVRSSRSPHWTYWHCSLCWPMFSFRIRGAGLSILAKFFWGCAHFNTGRSI